jgi:MYXO-CTERM domain-containing protein
VIKKGDGTLAPAGLPGLGNAGGQAINLGAMAKIDFGTAASGVDELLAEYCLARGSFSSGICTGACVTPHGLPSNYDVQHLWSITHLAARKSAMTPAQLASLRNALQCGWTDPQAAFRYTAAFVLGYLGNDAGAKTFLTNIATTASDANDKLAAKAALVAMGDGTYKADVTSGISGGDEYAQDVCAAALGIVDKDDKVVTDVLLARARWICPASCDAGDNPKPFFAAHLLEIVSWDRRGFAQNAEDKGYPSYFTGGGGNVGPGSTGGCGCTATPGGSALSPLVALAAAAMLMAKSRRRRHD